MKGEIIKEAMQFKGLNQTSLARLMYVKQNTVSKWIRGKSEPSLDTVFYAL
ncbi:MAG: helix-turn-helix transcriptional regulator [Clostridia bacterium]|nr:helix-turn-helix transcriptional regulator [Clostridia bacterium]